jgi:hypothetical protein
VGNVKRAIASNLGEICGKQPLVVVVAGGLVEVLLGVFPVPFFASKLGPVVKGGSAASDPGVVTV